VKTNTMCVSVVFVAVAGVVGVAAGSPLPPDSTILPVPSVPQPVGGPNFAILAQGSTPVTASTFSGTVHWYVLQGVSNSPLPGLTFGYRVENNASSPHAISRIAINGFGATSQLDVGYFNGPAGTVVPSYADRDGTANGVVGFQFASFLLGEITPGASSKELIIYSNATSWVVAEAGLINGSIATVAVPAYIPAPGVAGLVGAGLMLAGRRRR
jgi:hypothetical protein